MLIKHIFIGVGALSSALSFLHLGKKSRSWRALLNLKNSWISREIAGLTLFYGVVFVDFYFYNIPNIIGIAIGLIFLYSIDMLYRLATRLWPTKVHSAQTLLIAFTITFLIKEQMIILGAVIFVRILLYIFRKYYSDESNFLISILRILLLIVPIILFMLKIDIYIVIISLILGEIIDHIEFFNELNVPDPRQEFVSGM